MGLVFFQDIDNQIEMCYGDTALIMDLEGDTLCPFWNTYKQLEMQWRLQQWGLTKTVIGNNELSATIDNLDGSNEEAARGIWSNITRKIPTANGILCWIAFDHVNMFCLFKLDRNNPKLTIIHQQELSQQQLVL